MHAPARRNTGDWTQPHDARRMGEITPDPDEQQRWYRELFWGTKP